MWDFCILVTSTDWPQQSLKRGERSSSIDMRSGEILGNGRRRLVQRLTFRLHDDNQDAQSDADLAILMKTLAQELLRVVPSHILFRRPAAAVPSRVSGFYGGPASAAARNVMDGDDLELVTEEADGVARSRGLLTVLETPRTVRWSRPPSAQDNEAWQNQ